MPRACAVLTASASGTAIFSNLSSGHAAAADHLGERLAADQFHRDEDVTVGFVDRVDGDDVGMIQGGDRSRFALESLAPFGIGGGVGRQQFEGDVALQFRIACAIDLAHAAFAEERQDFVVREAGGRGQLRRQRRGHRLGESYLSGQGPRGCIADSSDPRLDATSPSDPQPIPQRFVDGV
jgi:hypothetical protein